MNDKRTNNRDEGRGERERERDRESNKIRSLFQLLHPHPHPTLLSSLSAHKATKLNKLEPIQKAMWRDVCVWVWVGGWEG